MFENVSSHNSIESYYKNNNAITKKSQQQDNQIVERNNRDIVILGVSILALIALTYTTYNLYNSNKNLLIENSKLEELNDKMTYDLNLNKIDVAYWKELASIMQANCYGCYERLRLSGLFNKPYKAFSEDIQNSNKMCLV